MKTLIELYDERPLENVLGTEMFQPERVVYVCDVNNAPDKRMQRKLREFFRHRGLEPELEFATAKVYDTDAVLAVLRDVVKRWPDCGLDITGGTDAVLFAAGLLAAETDLEVVTYSRRMNCFYNIRGASFGGKLPCRVSYSVEDCFLMAGGSMRPGRVDNAVLEKYLDDIEPFFKLFMVHRRSWVKIVNYLQRVSQCPPDGPVRLDVKGDYTVKGERGSRIEAPEEALVGLETIGFIRDLNIEKGESVSFSFRDAQIRAWLRDVGSVLELYVYKACLDSGLFQDVVTSAVVDWEGDARANAVTNELDVMCTRGVIPVFISCKTCDVKTEALNELAILRDRFGGKIARAAIVTAEGGGTAMRNRASELDILVIDLNDLSAGRIGQRIKTWMRNLK
ncbi:MAG: DUF1887 family protein [Oscillospiraceae bacterium]|nr:DUF1887 family protein [Oscillospiraceae bacterium]